MELKNRFEDRAKEFHNKVDDIKENIKKELNELKTSNLAILYEQEEKVSYGLEKVKQEIKDCEDQLRSSDTKNLLEYEDTQHRKKYILPSITIAIPPVFTQSQIDTRSLTEMFGQLSIPKITQGTDGHTQPTINTPLHTQESSTTGSTEKPTKSETMNSTPASYSKPIEASSRDPQVSSIDNTASSKLPTRLITVPLIQSKFHSLASRQAIACVGPDKAWVQRESKKIQLVDMHGLSKGHHRHRL